MAARRQLVPIAMLHRVGITMAHCRLNTPLWSSLPATDVLSSTVTVATEGFRILACGSAPALTMARVKNSSPSSSVSLMTDMLAQLVDSICPTSNTTSNGWGMATSSPTTVCIWLAVSNKTGYKRKLSHLLCAVLCSEAHCQSCFKTTTHPRLHTDTDWSLVCYELTCHKSYFCI